MKTKSKKAYEEVFDFLISKYIKTSLKYIFYILYLTSSIHGILKIFIDCDIYVFFIFLRILLELFDFFFQKDIWRFRV